MGLISVLKKKTESGNSCLKIIMISKKVDMSESVDMSGRMKEDLEVRVVI